MYFTVTWVWIAPHWKVYNMICLCMHKYNNSSPWHCCQMSLLPLLAELKRWTQSTKITNMKYSQIKELSRLFVTLTAMLLCHCLYMVALCNSCWYLSSYHSILSQQHWAIQQIKLFNGFAKPCLKLMCTVYLTVLFDCNCMMTALHV